MPVLFLLTRVFVYVALSLLGILVLPAYTERFKLSWKIAGIFFGISATISASRLADPNGIWIQMVDFLLMPMALFLLVGIAWDLWRVAKHRM